MKHGESNVHDLAAMASSVIGGGSAIDRSITGGDSGALPVNALIELVADLIATTGLLPADRLALARGRSAQEGSFAEALVAEGLASSEGVARTLAARHRLPYVDLTLTGIAADAAVQMPVHVLRRATALPYRLEDDTLHVAIADPGNVNAIDELRLATRYRLALGVATEADILAELERIGRVSEAVLEAPEESDIDGSEVADIEEEDGVTDGQIVQIVNSIILQAAEDGASDIHFEAQEDEPRHPLPGRRAAARDPADPQESHDGRRRHASRCWRARHRRAPPAAGRPHLAARRSMGRPLDIRVATLPTVSGEKVVHAAPRQVEERTDARGARALRRRCARRSPR